MRSCPDISSTAVARPRRWACHLAPVPRYRGIGSEAYLNGTSQEPTPEDARLPARRAYSSERRTAISVVAAGDS
jgi:hypothetical protein